MTAAEAYAAAYTYEIRAAGAVAYAEGIATLGQARRLLREAERVCPRSCGEPGWRIVRVAADGGREWVE